MRIFELKKQQQEALDMAERTVANIESQHRAPTEYESQAINSFIAKAAECKTQIKALESQNTISRAFPNPAALLMGGAGPRADYRVSKKTLSPDYAADFFTMIRTKGTQLGPNLSEGADGLGGYVLPGNPSAALYEGGSGAGGYAVNVTTDDQIVPLAPQEMSVRRLAQVIPTANDILIPQKASFGTASYKAESGSSTNLFTESDPTLTQIRLSAYMAGIQETISWELAQDVPAFQAFAVDDMILAQQMFEENWYINGTGTNQAQGLIGNVGAGVVEEPDSNGNMVSIAGTLDLLSKLNAVYFANASWLMSRATGVILRKAQIQSNLFFQAFTRVDGQDYLHGFPVYYAGAMPAATRGSAPILFGDFKRGYVIADRGGSGINVKVLDQPLATAGQIILLAYRRTDGRVRRSEAIQQYTIAAS